MEVWATLEKQHTVCRPPNRFIKHCRLGAGWYQCNSVAMVTHSPQPLHSLAPKGRIKPNPAYPRQRQPIILRRIVLLGSFPRANYRGAWVKVKLSEFAQDLGRCQPLIILHRSALMSA
jgi:hypothetical protein